MRRKEFLIEDADILAKYLEGMEWGTFAMVDGEGLPYQASVNPVWHNNTLYFHSALGGKKVQLMKNNPRVHFSYVFPLSIIPSHLSGPDLACNATQFFISIHIAGQAAFVEDPHVKAKALSILMERLQPEGGYAKMDGDHPLYQQEIKKTAVIAVEPTSMSGKFKLGQNLTPESKRIIIEFLKEGNSPTDLATAGLIEEFM